MVTGKDDTAGSTDGNPTGSLQCLCRLVDEQSTEFLSIQQAVGCSNQCTGNDTCLTEEFVVDAYLQFCSPSFQTLQASGEISRLPVCDGHAVP